jgi:hypothetical protein
MFPNLGIVALAALVPMVVGFLYYHPKNFANTWIKISGMTEEKIRKGNMGLKYGLTYVMSCLIGIALFMFVVHQTDIYSLFSNQEGFGEEGSAIMTELSEFMNRFGDNFRTFQHGAFHGAIIGVLFVTPLLTTNDLFEGKSAKYGIINGGYWTITLSLMGGILCQWG